MKVTASYSRTVQVRQYEPARVVAALEAEVPEAEAAAAYRAMFEQCRVLVNEPIAKIHKHDAAFRERD